jgi:hypothetical protein
MKLIAVVAQILGQLPKIRREKIYLNETAAGYFILLQYLSLI